MEALKSLFFSISLSAIYFLGLFRMAESQSFLSVELFLQVSYLVGAESNNTFEYALLDSNNSQLFGQSVSNEFTVLGSSTILQNAVNLSVYSISEVAFSVSGNSGDALGFVHQIGIGQLSNGMWSVLGARMNVYNYYLDNMEAWKLPRDPGCCFQNSTNSQINQVRKKHFHHFQKKMKDISINFIKMSLRRIITESF